MVGFFPNFLISVNIIFVMVVNILTSVNIIFISVSIISVIWRTGQGFFIMQNRIDQNGGEPKRPMLVKAADVLG